MPAPSEKHRRNCEISIDMAIDASDLAASRESIQRAKATLALAERRDALAQIHQLFASTASKLATSKALCFKACLRPHPDGDDYEAECLVDGSHPYAQDSPESDILYDAGDQMRHLLERWAIRGVFKARKAFSLEGSALSIESPWDAAELLLPPKHAALWRSDFERRALDAASTAPPAAAKARPTL